MSKNSIPNSQPNESDEYLPVTENSYEILCDCKSLLTSHKMDTIRIIFKEIVDVQSIKRHIFTNGIIDMTNKILFSDFFNSFLDYISESDDFIITHPIFEEKALNNYEDIYNKIYYINSSKRQNIFNINGNIIYFEDFLAKEELKNNLKLLIFWRDKKDIESNMKNYIDIAKIYSKYLSIVFISNISDFVEKKLFLQENNYYRAMDNDTQNMSDKNYLQSNVYYIFDDKFLQNKFYVFKYPFFTLLNTNNDILDSGILMAENIQERIANFLDENPNSGQNIKNLFWLDLSNKIKINLVRKINLEIKKYNYKNIYFFIETNSSIANENLKSSFDIDAYFIGNVSFQEENNFKELAKKICDENKIENIHFRLNN